MLAAKISAGPKGIRQYGLLSSISSLDKLSLIKFFFENQNIDTGIIFVSSIIGFLTFAIYILAGLGGLFRYSNRKNLLSKLVGPFAILLILQLVFILTMSAISSEWSAITSSISGLIIDILYIFGYFAERKD